MQAGEACTGLSSSCRGLRDGSASRNRGREYEGERQDLPHPPLPSDRFKNSGTTYSYASARFRFSIASSISAVFL